MRRLTIRLCCLLATLILRPIAHLEPVDLGSTPEPDRGLILVTNHRSVADILVGLALFWHWGITPRMLVKAHYFEVPIAGVMLRLLRAIPAGGESPAATMRTALSTLSAGGIVALAPEGRVADPNSPASDFGPLRTGAGRLAAELGTRVVAVGMVNTDAMWPRGSRLPKVRARRRSRPTIRVATVSVEVTRGAPVAPVMADIKEAMTEAVRTAESPVRTQP